MYYRMNIVNFAGIIHQTFITMRKTYILLAINALLLLGLTGASAQSFNAGLIVGPSFCQVDGDDYFGYHQLGFTTGAYVNLFVAEHLAVQMELKYSLHGAHSSDIEVNEYNYLPYNLRLHYAEIPLMLRYDLGALRFRSRLFDAIILEAGTSLDFRLKATEDVDADYETTTYRWNSFSMTGNVGAHFAFNNHWGMGARWLYSIVPCRFSGELPSWFYGHYYNKVWQVFVTYNLNSPLR